MANPCPLGGLAHVEEEACGCPAGPWLRQAARTAEVTTEPRCRRPPWPRFRSTDPGRAGAVWEMHFLWIGPLSGAPVGADGVQLGQQGSQKLGPAIP